jgi:hypothetical protein
MLAADELGRGRDLRDWYKEVRVLGRKQKRSRLLWEVSQEGTRLMSDRERTKLGSPFCRIESGMFGVNADSMESLNVYS